jgi:hypothetical protein
MGRRKKKTSEEKISEKTEQELEMKVDTVQKKCVDKLVSFSIFLFFA